MHPGRPPLHNPALADHLELGTTELTPETWRDFGIDNLHSWAGTTSKLNKANSSDRAPPWGMASAYRPGTNEIMQPVQEDIMALLKPKPPRPCGRKRRPCPHAVQRPHRCGFCSPMCRRAQDMPYHPYRRQT
eukprot:3318389-Prymnesium_polylepis.1